MTKSTRTRRCGAVLSVIILVASACGGDDDSASVETVPPTSTAPPTTAAPTTTTTSTTTTTEPTLVGTPAFDESSTVSTVGIDRVTFGMTLVEAERTLGTTLVEVEGSGTGDCVQVRPMGGPAGVELTLTNGTIERVDISTDIITTRSGAGVGSTEDELFALFPNNLTRTARDGGGNDVVFTPSDAADAAFRVIFETDGTVVTRYRSGRVPQVEGSAPCAV